MLTWSIGDVRITRIVENEGPLSERFAASILPDATPVAVKTIPWLAPHFITPEGALNFSVHAFVVETPSLRIVVDTCVGNDRDRMPIRRWTQMQTAFLQDFERAGFRRNEIDRVVCTHLHLDHVGWNTMLVDGRFVPTFPNARYLIGETELAHARAEAEANPEHYDSLAFVDAVKPILDAGLATAVKSDHRLCEEVWLEPTPGHTPGHVSVRIRSRGMDAIITGDLMHHPAQVARPEWCALADRDPSAARATRARILERFADTPVLILGTHFAAPTAGRIVRDGDGHRFVV